MDQFSIFQYLMDHSVQLLGIGSSAIGVFAMVAALTPNTSDNVIADFLLRLINTAGMNVGKAKNDPFIR
jgi:hypothetical protein